MTVAEGRRQRLSGLTLLPMREGVDAIEHGALILCGDRIAYAGAASAAPAPLPGEVATDLTGKVAIPGLIQSHIHLCQVLFRNHADDLLLLDWLKERIWPFEAAHDRSSLRASADLGLAELLRGGTTAILDMGTVRHTDALFEAAREAGIRYTGGKCHMDARGGQPEPLCEETAASLEEADELRRRWHGAEGGRLRYAYAPRFVLSCTEELLRATAERARASGTRVHTHASENPEECAIVRRTYGRDNIDLFHAWEMGGDGLCLAHCVHATDAEMGVLAAAGTHVMHCPSANLKLGSGIARVPEMLARGVRVSLGADGAPCNNMLCAFQEMRLAALLQKPRLGPRAMPAKAALRLATVGGAEALGLGHELGRLEAGFLADVTVLDLRDVGTEPEGDLYARIVYSAQSRHVTDVFVGGRRLVRDREVQTLDLPRVAARAVEERRRLLPRIEELRPTA